MSTATDSNHVLDFALNHQFPPYSQEEGVDRVVAFGEQSHKCPVYNRRIPPCQSECPAGEDIRGVQNLLRGVEKSENKWEEAFYRIVERNPFPAIMGRVCPAPCQGGCNRSKLDESVSINAVEHAVGEYGINNNLPLKRLSTESTGKHIAVVGGGPGGLSCAYQLARRGHKVTIYEAQQKLGGMVRYGIMGYRVDRGVLEQETQRILDLGIEVKCGIKIGRDLSLADLEAQHDAVFLAVGAQKGRNLPVPGSEGTKFSSNAVQFLMEYEANPDTMTIGKDVVVVGDGDVAMDIGRLSLRLGSKAKVLSAVPREEMNCKGYEYDEAAQEGTQFEFGVSVVEILRDGDKVRGVKCVKMAKKDKGEDGCNSPIPFLRYKPVAGSEFEIACDMLVASIGQMTDMEGLDAATAGKPFLQADRRSNYQIKGSEKLFGGGDAVKIDLITTAVGHGRIAAEAIHNFVLGEPLPIAPREEIVKFDRLHTYYFQPKPVTQRKHKQVDTVKGNFDELLEKLDDTVIEQESDRCMSCGLCFTCKQCLLFCPQEAIQLFRTNPIGQTLFTDYTRCVGCHICAEVCPCGYIDMAMGDGM